MPDAIYDTLKYLAQYILPACAALYTTLGALWGFGYITEIVGTITAVDTLLGVILGVNTAVYKKNTSV